MTNRAEVEWEAARSQASTSRHPITHEKLVRWLELVSLTVVILGNLLSVVQQIIHW